jgi:hypothetical protein
VAKVFDTVWVKSLLYKLTVLNSPCYLVKNLSSYLDCRTFQTSLQTATSTSRVMRAGVAQGGIVSPVLFSLYVNDIPTPSRHVQLAQYADALSYPRPATCLFSSVIWRPTWVDWSSGFGTGGSLSTSQRARPCSLPRPRDAPDSPGQFNFSGSQLSVSKPPAI